MASVFVGNIPFDATEEMLIAHFSQVGPVVAFRVVNDKETGRPKGYGFCEYRDPEMAMCAARNLNDLELNGRQLRVSLPDGISENGSGGSSAQAGRNDTMLLAQISSVVSGMTTEQLADLLMSARTYVGKEPHHAHELLSKHPPLAHALMQAIIRVQGILSLQPPKQAGSAHDGLR